MSSVREINEYVQDIVATATKYISRINVMYAVRDLMTKNEMLGDYFEQAGYKTETLAEMKSDVSRLYIRLEYILSEFEEKYLHDYIKRTKIKKYYTEIVSLAKCKSISVEERAQAFLYMRDIASAYLNLSQINVDDVSDEKLDLIIKFIGDKEKCLM